MKWLGWDENNPITTPKCVLVHFKFYHILNEFGHFYHDEINKPSNKQGPIVTDSELIH
jgi:hypothetical protein